MLYWHSQQRQEIIETLEDEYVLSRIWREDGSSLTPVARLDKNSLGPIASCTISKEAAMRFCRACWILYGETAGTIVLGPSLSNDGCGMWFAPRYWLTILAFLVTVQLSSSRGNAVSDTPFRCSCLGDNEQPQSWVAYYAVWPPTSKEGMFPPRWPFWTGIVGYWPLAHWHTRWRCDYAC